MISQAEMDNIAYKHNFLTDVIVRADFAAPQDALNNSLPSEIRRKATEHFPIEEPKTGVIQEVAFGPAFSSKQSGFVEWQFWGKRREKRVTIAPNFVVLTYKEYSKYEELRKESVELLEAVAGVLQIQQVGRLGLRYINRVELPGGDVLVWSKYISDRLLGLFSFAVEGAEPTRVFHNYELIYPSHNLRFQYGVDNPDYPAPIRRKAFVLDYDAYYRGLLNCTDIPLRLDLCHASIQRLFETSIADGLRKVMNE